MSKSGDPAQELSGASDDASHSRPQGNQAPFALRWRERIVISCLMIIAFFTSCEGTGVGVPLAKIITTLHGSSIQAIWIGSSYFVAATVAQPLFASFSHIFGRKIPLTASVGIFSIGTIICAVSTHVVVMLVGRTIQGLGCGGAITMTDILITDLVPLRQRGTYFGLVSLSWAFGTSLGPVVGGGFAQGVTWRWLFWVLLPFGGVTLVVIPITLRLKEKKSDAVSNLKQVDWVGAFLFVASSASFLIAISWGGIEFAWSSAHTLVPLLLGILGLGGFVFWEARCPASTSPLLPLQIFKSRTGASGYFQIVINGGILWALVYYMPLYFNVVKGYSLVITGVSLFPQTLLVAPVALVTGVTIAKIGKYRKFLWAGWAIGILGFGLMIRLDMRTTIPQWIFINMVGGLGMGFLLPSMQLAVQAAASDEDQAFSAAMVATMRTLGQAVGLPIFGAIFQSVLKSRLEDSQLRDQAAALSSDAFETVLTIEAMRMESRDVALLLSAFQHAVRAIFIALIPASAIGLLASCFAKDLPLDRVLYTEHGVDYDRDEPDDEEANHERNLELTAIEGENSRT